MYIKIRLRIKTMARLKKHSNILDLRKFVSSSTKKKKKNELFFLRVFDCEFVLLLKRFR